MAGPSPSPFSLVPEQQTTYSDNTGNQYSQGTTNNQSTANTYNAGQTNLQGQLGDLWSNLTKGNVPTAFTNNPNLVGAYTTAFNQNISPELAASGGAGNPQIGSNYAMGLQALLANQYNTGIGQALNAATGASGYALTPTGQNATGSGTTVGGGITQNTGNQTTSIPYSLLQGLQNALQQGANWMQPGTGSNTVIGNPP